jgi:hypothetical protein
MHARLAASFVLALVAAITAFPAQAVQRTFVASYGSDANTASNCGFANPCRGFTAAQTVTDSGGEIVALDAAGYGPITITKSITLTANPGFYAGISVSSGNGVTIATAGVKVVLRGLNINGIGGNNGVLMTNGAKLSIENCVISNFIYSSFPGGTGVAVIAYATVRIVDSLIRDNDLDGVLVRDGATASISGSKFLGNGNAGVRVLAVVASAPTTAAISDSSFSGNLAGIWSSSLSATSPAHTSVTRSTIDNSSSTGIYSESNTGVSTVTASYNMLTGNGYGLYAGGANGIIESPGTNTVRQSGVNVSGTIAAAPGI